MTTKTETTETIRPFANRRDADRMAAEVGGVVFVVSETEDRSTYAVERQAIVRADDSMFRVIYGARGSSQLVRGGK